MINTRGPPRVEHKTRYEIIHHSDIEFYPTAVSYIECFYFVNI